MVSLVHSDPAIGSLNLTGYASPTTDTLAESLSQAVDPNEFAQLLDEIQVQIAQDLPFIMLLYPDGAFAYRAERVYGGWGFMAWAGHLPQALVPAGRPRP